MYLEFRWTHLSLVVRWSQCLRSALSILFRPCCLHFPEALVDLKTFYGYYWLQHWHYSIHVCVSVRACIACVYLCVKLQWWLTLSKNEIAIINNRQHFKCIFRNPETWISFSQAAEGWCDERCRAYVCMIIPTRWRRRLLQIELHPSCPCISSSSVIHAVVIHWTDSCLHDVSSYVNFLVSRKAITNATISENWWHHTG